MANIFEAEFGGQSAVSEATGAAVNSAAPPKASAAPVAGKQNIFVGLCASLNAHQQDLVKQKKREIADQYAVEFAPASTGAATLTRPGPQDATTAPMQNNNSAKKLDMEETQVNRSARTWPIKAGTQIVKVIDDVMRNSSFITEQQNVEITTAVDPVTGIQTQKINPKAGTNNMQWYKITVAVKDLGYDTIIRDQAYKITFVITPYAVAQMTSQYFPDSRYRGVHKAYNYWFTGQNTQILSYEQSYNNAYRLALSGIGADTQQKTNTDFRDQNRYIYMATSTDQSTGAKNYASEPANSGASFLYDPSSLSQVRLRIVGDPAWLQQGEAALGVSSKTFDFNPFNADGSINFDSQAVMFSVAFNTPNDYNFNTGLVDVTSNNRSGKPQEYFTFQAISCKSVFSKGRFEQELEGKLLIEKKGGQAAEARPSTVAGSAPGNRTNAAADQIINRTIEADKTGSLTAAEFGGQDELSLATGVTETEPTPRPAPPPRPPTSSGDLEFGGSDTFEALGAGSASPQPSRPQIMKRET
jgi:hypothetical protein